MASNSKYVHKGGGSQTIRDNETGPLDSDKSKLLKNISMVILKKQVFIFPGQWGDKAEIINYCPVWF